MTTDVIGLSSVHNASNPPGQYQFSARFSTADANELQVVIPTAASGVASTINEYPAPGTADQNFSVWDVNLSTQLNGLTGGRENNTPVLQQVYTP